MPYLGYLLAQAVKAGQTVASAITSATNYVTRVGSSVVELSASAEVLKSPSSGSAVFNGSSDYVRTPNLPFQSSSIWTYSAWLNLTDVSVARYFFDAREDTFDGFGLYTTSSGVFTYFDNNGGVTTGSIFPMSTWFHLAITRNGTSSVNFYINGNLRQTITVTQTSYSVTGNFYIGSRFSASETFKGNMSNVATWSRPLSAEEVRSVMMKSYDDLSASETKGLVSWYALDNISGTTVPDSHGNFNGTAY
jgi:hypothetical protein